MQSNHEIVVPNEDLPFKMFLFEGRREIISGINTGIAPLKFLWCLRVI